MKRLYQQIDCFLQVYYPITFAQYNPDIVKEYSPEGKVNGLNEINKYTGKAAHTRVGTIVRFQKRTTWDDL